MFKQNRTGEKLMFCSSGNAIGVDVRVMFDTLLVVLVVSVLFFVLLVSCFLSFCVLHCELAYSCMGMVSYVC